MYIHLFCHTRCQRLLPCRACAQACVAQQGH